ncbi:hypothetical protein [Mammaliicoccus sciuri]|uniref:hypothetical protein n=1 Tax=Mammaliicoccus sciuri TaxID=1296 RepID=UPI002737B0E5|nr:hypothetical protein [Mammaliicoccus sciuri]
MKLNLVALIILPIMVVSLFLGFLLSNIDSSNKLDAYSIAISFIGLFATFGGAYLGAKKSGDIAYERDRRNEEIRKNNDIEKIKNIIEMNEFYLFEISNLFFDLYSIKKEINFLSILKNKRYELYNEQNHPIDLKNNKHIQFLNEYVQDFNHVKLDKKHNDIINNIDLITNILHKISFEMKDFSNAEKNTIYKLKQVLPKFKKFITISKSGNSYHFETYNVDSQNELKSLFLDYCILIIDVHEKILKLSI